MNESQIEFFADTLTNVPAIVDSGSKRQVDFAMNFLKLMQLSHLYESAIKVVKTHLDILSEEFSVRFQRNLIHSVEQRVKSPESIMNKLRKKGLPTTPESAQKNLLDIAGIRVICCYISDIYNIVDLLCRRDDYIIIKQKDYIKNPKPSGYRSYHMIINVPVHLSDKKYYAPVEIQIRTIAMDFWASLEHQLKYKTSNVVTPEISQQLLECAERIARTDMEMQEIFTKINKL